MVGNHLIDIEEAVQRIKRSNPHIEEAAIRELLEMPDDMELASRLEADNEY